DSTACVYIDDGAKFKRQEDDSGALVKYVAVLAMDGGIAFEKKAVEYWGSKIIVLRELIAQYKREKQWGSDGGSCMVCPFLICAELRLMYVVKNILINHVTNELIEHCQ